MRNFDHNATHPLSAAARLAWLDAVERFPANPSSPHRWASRAATALDDARQRLADRLDCHAGDLVWTSGATESNNAALHHLGLATEGPVLLSSIEHPSVRAAARRWLPGRYREIPVGRDGVVDLNWITERFAAGPVAAVVVMAANNETGVLQPWAEIHALCRSVNVPFVCDAAQWLGKLPAAGLGRCDLLAGCAHKFGGPAGVGFLKCPSSFRPFLVGGPQEDRRRAGTENVPGVLAMIAALEEREARMAPPPTPAGRSVSEPVCLPAERVAGRDRFIERLRSRWPEIEIIGAHVPRLWNTVAALMPAAADCRRRWVVRLDRLGFAVSTGSACSSGKEQPSHVLAAMGYRPEESDRMLRFSAGWETTDRDWDELLAAIDAAAESLSA